MDWLVELQQKLKGTLPGSKIQWQMAHASRPYDSRPVVPVNATKAGVLILLFPGTDKLVKTVLIERVPNQHDHHSGQISFPGGRMETGDPHPEYTAAREAEEEIGVPKNDIRLIGSLSQLYIPVSGFLVYPVVGLVDYTPVFVPQPQEVADVFDVSLQALLRAETRKIRNIIIGEHLVLQDVPYFDVNGKVVWGATAMILNEFLHLVQGLRNPPLKF